MQRYVKLSVSVLLVLFVIIMPSAAVLRAGDAARPMQDHDFTDVPVEGQEFMGPYIDAFFHQGITNGCSLSPQMYCPLNPVTRGSMAVFIGRALGYLDAVEDGYEARAYFKQTDTDGSAHGVIATSINASAVYGIGTNGYGVFGESTNGTGVGGSSTANWGVHGLSTNSYGVSAQSSTQTGLLAIGGADSPTDTVYDIYLDGAFGEIFAETFMLGSKSNVLVELNDDNVGSGSFMIRSGADSFVFSVTETGAATALDTFTVTGNNGNAITASSPVGHGVSASGAANSISDALYDVVLGGALGELFATNLFAASDSNMTFDLDNDNAGGGTFAIRNGSNSSVFTVTHGGNVSATASSGIAVTAANTNGTALLASGSGNTPSDALYDLSLGGGLGEIFATFLYTVSDSSMIFDLDNDANGADSFQIRNGTDNTVFNVDESGIVTTSGQVVAVSTVDNGLEVGGAGDSASDSFYDILLGGGLGEIYASFMYLVSDNGFVIDLDNNNNGTDTFTIRNGADGIVLNLDESGNLTTSGQVVAASTVDNGLEVSGAANTATDSLYDILLGGGLGEIYSSFMYLVSDSGYVIDLDNNNNGNDTFQIRSGTDSIALQLAEDGTLTVTNLQVSGTKNNIVDTVSYGTRAMYAVESTEYWFEDMGTAQLVDGEVVIEFDPMFAETVNFEEDYQVFLTPVGGWAELYVAEKTDTYFVVRATDPDSTLTFDYRIVAKRLGYEDVRMEEVGD